MPDIAQRLLTTESATAAFSAGASARAMLAFEAALARAQAAAGLIPEAAAQAIDRGCAELPVEPASLARRGARAGTPVIPLVRDLEARVAGIDPGAVRWVHWGATSQDVMDTALVLQMREATALLDADLERVVAATAGLARAHAGTPMTGRTLLQPGLPVTFGLKAAHWSAAARRGRRRLAEAASEALLLQFGGAVGTLSAFGGGGLELARALAAELDLPLPEAPWHGQRDRLVALASAVAILCGSLGKAASDVSLLMQAEVAEVFEPAGEGRGTSSAMPHKRNPVGCMIALAAAKRAPGLLATLAGAMVQEQERGLGGWQAEWVALPDLFRAAAGACAAMAEVMEGLRVDARAMRANLRRTRGLVFSEALTAALARKLGKAKARDLAEAAARAALEAERDLEAVARDTPEIAAVLDATALAGVFDLEAALGSSRQLVERLLAG